MRSSLPVSLSIPAIQVNSSGMLHLGQTARGELQVPAGADYDKVAWFRNSPTPGSLGPAVLVGHVDSAANGPSVFARLGALKRGDLVRVTRADRSVAVFKVDDVKRFSKNGFPTNLVYGDTDHAALRLITCGGPFDSDAGHYVDNTIALASLVS
jgi:sortase (surface protein transpeptidase)